jgi:ElaB/YqjD/DUF883 family membrane-anchored ribosome-binding protein
VDHDETPELIEARMAATRSSLADKVAALETQVMGTIQNATNTVTDTVDSVRTVMTDTPSTVKEVVHESLQAVKQSLDVRESVRENPWVAIGSAAAVGFLAGLIVFRDRRASLPASAHATYHPLAGSAAAATAPSAPREPGLFDELLSRATRELRVIAEDAIRTATESLKSSVHDNVPKLVERLTDKVTGESTATPASSGSIGYGATHPRVTV